MHPICYCCKHHQLPSGADITGNRGITERAVIGLQQQSLCMVMAAGSTQLASSYLKQLRVKVGWQGSGLKAELSTIPDWWWYPVPSTSAWVTLPLVMGCTDNKHYMWHNDSPYVFMMRLTAAFPQNNSTTFTLKSIQLLLIHQLFGVKLLYLSWVSLFFY